MTAGPLSRPALAIRNLRRPVATALAGLGWITLGLQLYLMIRKSGSSPGELAGTVVQFLSFFTILSNLLVAVALTATARSAGAGAEGFCEQPRVAAGLAVYMAVVGLVYNLFLEHLWQPTGLQFTADVLLHDVLPIAYVVYWLALVPKGQLVWHDVLAWLWFPLGYVLYSGVRGPWVKWYPYPFLDVGALGYPIALRNCALITLGFLIIGLGFVAMDRVLGRRAPHRLIA